MFVVVKFFMTTIVNFPAMVAICFPTLLILRKVSAVVIVSVIPSIMCKHFSRVRPCIRYNFQCQRWVRTLKQYSNIFRPKQCHPKLIFILIAILRRIHIYHLRYFR